MCWLLPNGLQQMQQGGEVGDLRVKLGRAAQTVGGPDKGHARHPRGLQVALGIAHIAGADDVVAAHQRPDGLALAGSRVAEAVVIPDQGAQIALVQQDFNVSLLAVAHDEQPEPSGQFGQRFLHAGIENPAGVAPQVFQLPLAAPLHHLRCPLGRLPGRQRPGDFRHGFAEQPLNVGPGAACRKTQLRQGEVPGFGHQIHGVPQSAVHIKNNTFYLHSILSAKRRGINAPALFCTVSGALS